MFSLNGILLQDPVREWRVLGATSVLTPVEVERDDLTIPGRDGSVPTRGRVSAPVVPVVVRTPRANQEALRALFRHRGSDDSVGAPLVLRELAYAREAAVELVSLSPVGYGSAHELVDLTALFRVPGVFWRDIAETTTPAAAIGSASVDVSVMSGLSAPVRDAVVRVKGGVTGLKVRDANGSFFSYPAVLTSGQWLRFESATGRAFLTTSDTWTGGTEITGQMGSGPGPYPLELTPYFTTDPGSRVARLTVISTARSGSPTIEIRGKRAYEV